jgi:hypothetical protein
VNAERNLFIKILINKNAEACFHAVPDKHSPGSLTSCAGQSKNQKTDCCFAGMRPKPQNDSEIASTLRLLRVGQVPPVITGAAPRFIVPGSGKHASSAQRPGTSHRDNNMSLLRLTGNISINKAYFIYF